MNELLYIYLFNLFKLKEIYDYVLLLALTIIIVIERGVSGGENANIT